MSRQPADDVDIQAGVRHRGVIASDLDGTLLRIDSTVSARTIEAVERAIDAGFVFVPVTGRPQPMAVDIVRQLPMVDYWVFGNGSTTWHQGRNEVLRNHSFSPEFAAEMINRTRAEIPNLCFGVDTAEGPLFEAGYSALVPDLEALDPYSNVADHLTMPIHKILVFEPAGVPSDLFGLLRPIVGNDGVVAHSGLAFLEITENLIDKSTALADLAGDLGVTSADVATFGDYLNDIPMLSWAGQSFAIAHADPSVKASADHVIGSNEDDAVAGIINRIVDGEFLPG